MYLLDGVWFRASGVPCFGQQSSELLLVDLGLRTLVQAWVEDVWPQVVGNSGAQEIRLWIRKRATDDAIFNMPNLGVSKNQRPQ